MARSLGWFIASSWAKTVAVRVFMSTRKTLWPVWSAMNIVPAASNRIPLPALFSGKARNSSARPSGVTRAMLRASRKLTQ